MDPHAPKSQFRTQLPHDPSHVVGIGASAGGLTPLRALLHRFTADKTAFVVVMHLTPDRESSLTSILAKSTTMTVATATDGMVLERNHIYVIPPGFVLRLSDEGTLLMTALPKTYPRWTIDKFLCSLGEIGPAAIGVILSGTGSDGSDGLKQIREQGGTTFVQDPASAQSPEMPQSARRFADYCLAPDALGDALMRTIGATPKPASAEAGEGAR